MVKSFPSIESLTKVLAEISVNYPILRVELFGSLAKGEFSASSDIDLLVDFVLDAEVGLFEMGALKEDLEDRLGFTVDLISREAIENSSNSFVKKSVLAAPISVFSK